MRLVAVFASGLLAMAAGCDDGGGDSGTDGVGGSSGGSGGSGGKPVGPVPLDPTAFTYALEEGTSALPT